MAGKTLSTAVKVDGEREYKKAIQEISSGLRVLSSEMKLVTERYADNADSTDALRAKNDLLQRQISTQKEKVDTLRQAHAEAARVYGESSKKTEAWQKQLNYEEAQLLKLERQLRENASAYDYLNSAEGQADAALQESNRTLADCDQRLQVLASELNRTAEQYRDSAGSAEALAERTDLLTKKQEAQQQKVDALRAALKTASDAYGENDERTRKLRVQLNNEETQLMKTTRELKSATDATAALSASEQDAEKSGSGFGDLLGDLSGKSQGLGDTIGGLANKLGVNLPPSLTKAANGLGSVSGGTVAAAGGAAALVAVIVKCEQALIAVAKESAAWADELVTLSKTSNLSVQTLQELNYAADFLDVSTTTVTGSLTKLTNKMQDAQSGTGAAAEAFARLGVDVTDADGQLRRAEDVFLDCIDALGAVGNETERDALAMDLFGRSAQELNPLIKDGSDRLRELSKEAHDAGYVLSNEDVNALAGVQDGFDKLDKTVESAKNTIAAQFAPALSDTLDSASGAVSTLGDGLAKSGLVENFGSILSSAGSLLEVLANVAPPVLKVLGDALQPIAQLLALIADTATVIHGLLTFDLDKIKTGLGLNTASGQLSNMQKIDPYWRERLKGSTYDAAAGGWVSGSSGVSGGSGYTAPTAGTQELNEEARRSNYEVSTDDWTKQFYIGHNAGGTDNWRGGWSWVGESGPELTWLPPQTQVLSRQASEDAVTGDTYNITIEARSIREFEDIVRLVKNQRRLRRMGVN